MWGEEGGGGRKETEFELFHFVVTLFAEVSFQHFMIFIIFILHKSEKDTCKHLYRNF